jgi:hypothetical protein
MAGRYVVTSLAGDPQHLYEEVYCKRGQMDNLIKLRKLSSRQTVATANQVRLVLYTAAFWLNPEFCIMPSNIICEL